MKSTFCRVVTALLILTCLMPLAQGAGRSKDLSPRYRHWLSQEVNYIIDSNEKKAFLALTSDAQRDSFIDNFWRVRNPDPNSSVNAYKEEHYQRLAYANEHYGSLGAEDGWRTDRGRIYIILGPPKQVVTYLSARNVRPMEIWFYQSANRALPPYFSLIFYKRSVGDDFSLYSPLSDGPVRLVSTLEAMNDQKRSLDTLRKSLGDEVATTAVCLIPGEPVNLHADDYEPSMSSDLLLSTIAGLPDNPLTQTMLNQNRSRERVTTSIFLGGQDSIISYDSFRDENGRMTLSYLMLMQFANPKLVGTHKAGNLYYDLTLRTDVTTLAGKVVYTQEDRMSGGLTAAEAEVARKKRFGGEARLPLAPGTYNLVATLTNNVDQVATKQREMIKVPAPKGDGIALSGLLAYTSPAGVPDPHGVLPFSVSHLRFTPHGAQNVYIRQGAKLPLVFQLWLNPRTSSTPDAEKVHIHYVWGSLAGSHEEPVRDDEDIDAGNRDAAGNLLTGHTLDTSSLPPGTSRVVVSANRDGEQKTAYATLNLHVSPSSEYIDMWTAYGPEDAGGEATDDLKRGIAAESQGADADAQTDYERALKEGSDMRAPDVRVLDRLAALFQRKGMTDQLANLSLNPILEKIPTDPGTLKAIAQALNTNGNPKGVVRMLDAQMKLQPPSADLYTLLADACQASGNAGRAHELRGLAANLGKQ